MPTTALTVENQRLSQSRYTNSIYAILLSSVARQRLCTPLRSPLAQGDDR